jgi:hypothetical protein
VSELIKKLETEKYIERKQNTNDKRITNIFLTEEGRKFSEKMRKNKISVLNEIFESIDEEDKKQLLNIIEKINSSVIKAKGGENNDNLHHKHYNGANRNPQHKLCSQHEKRGNY